MELVWSLFLLSTRMTFKIKTLKLKDSSFLFFLLHRDFNQMQGIGSGRPRNPFQLETTETDSQFNDVRMTKDFEVLNLPFDSTNHVHRSDYFLVNNFECNSGACLRVKGH